MERSIAQARPNELLRLAPSLDDGQYVKQLPL
jgi:hypothetical protein